MGVRGGREVIGGHGREEGCLPLASMFFFLAFPLNLLLIIPSNPVRGLGEPPKTKWNSIKLGDQAVFRIHRPIERPVLSSNSTSLDSASAR